MDHRPFIGDHHVIPYLAGDGVGPEVWGAARLVLDAGIAFAYGRNRTITWREVSAGAQAFASTGEWLPESTLAAFREHRVGIKGPLATEVGTGARSLNVALRQALDLYACIRPVRHMSGVPSPMRDPSKLDIVIYRENTEDVYAGIEWPAGSVQAQRLGRLLEEQFAARIRPDSAIGIKPMSEYASKRLIRAAIRHALTHEHRSVTIVHKGNIMKYTEGAFRNWGYQLAREEFGSVTIPESEVNGTGGNAQGRVVIKDRIADAMFQELLLQPNQHAVIATPNLNGDYLSDAAAAQVGGLGMTPGANIGDQVAIFEAVHGTAPGLAGRDRANPTAMILSGAMLLDHIGWNDAAHLVRQALERVIAAGRVTEDLARQMPGAATASTSEFARAVVDAVG